MTNAASPPLFSMTRLIIFTTSDNRYIYAIRSCARPHLHSLRIPVHAAPCSPLSTTFILDRQILREAVNVSPRIAVALKEDVQARRIVQRSVNSPDIVPDRSTAGKNWADRTGVTVSSNTFRRKYDYLLRNLTYDVRWGGRFSSINCGNPVPGNRLLLSTPNEHLLTEGEIIRLAGLSVSTKIRLTGGEL